MDIPLTSLRIVPLDSLRATIVRLTSLGCSGSVMEQFMGRPRRLLGIREDHCCSIRLCPSDANVVSPLIVSQPGTIPGGVVVQRSVNGPDITATLCDHAGVELLCSRNFVTIILSGATQKIESD